MRRPLLAAIATLAIATTAGCASASHPGAVATTTLPPPTPAVATGSTSHAAPATSSTSRVEATSTTRTGASSTTSSAPRSTSTTKPKATTTTTVADTSTSSPCAVASETIVHLTSGTLGGSDSATFTGTPVKAHCGGPDDVQYTTESGPVEHLLLTAGADVEVMTITDSGPQLQHSDPVELVKALPGDSGTRDFVVDGSLAQPTGLTELYHP